MNVRKLSLVPWLSKKTMGKTFLYGKPHSLNKFLNNYKKKKREKNPDHAQLRIFL